MVTDSLFRTSESVRPGFPQFSEDSIDNAYICLGVSVEVFVQSINCTHFPSLGSSFHFHCNIVHVSSLVVPNTFLDLLILDTVL